jgi:hypothetical protein
VRRAWMDIPTWGQVMRFVPRLLLTCVVLLATVVIVCGGSALAEETLGPSVPSSGSISLSGSPFVVPSAELLVGGQQAAAVEEAARASPEAVLQREISASEYENMGTAAAAALALEAFPGLSHPAGGPPPLSSGERISGFAGENVARVDVGDGSGRQAVIESSAPMALPTSSSGQFAPVDLGLFEVEGGFRPRTPVVGVRIPRHLSDGVALTVSGVSLTPVDGQGGALSGAEGSIDGASVFYGNTQTDTDTVIKPVESGFDAQSILRSAGGSPERLYSGSVCLPARDWCRMVAAWVR